MLKGRGGGRGKCQERAGEEEGTAAEGVRSREFKEQELTESAAQRGEGSSLDQERRHPVKKDG